MLIKAETKEKKEKISRFNLKMNKNFYKIEYKYMKKSFISKKNELFNNINLDKYEAYMIINKVDDLSTYIPHTQKVKNYNHIVKFAQKYEKVILRPIGISISSPKYFLEMSDDCIKITNNAKLKSGKKIIHSENELKELLQPNRISLDNYFIQKSIKSNRIGDLSYDIRVSMKKEMQKRWKCAALQFMIGENNILINKVSNESEEVYIKNALKKSLPLGCKQDELIMRINIICQKACNILEQTYPYLYEYVFDIAIDKEKKIWIIDINVLNSYKDFKQMDFKTYFSTKYASILYAASSNNFKYK